MRALLGWVLGTAVVVAGVLGVPPAQAEGPGPQGRQGPQADAVPVLLALASTPARSDEPSQVVVSATEATGAPLAGVPVTVERLQGGAWTPLVALGTDGNGVATLPVAVSRAPEENLLRATYGGDALHAPAVSPDHALTLVAREGRVRLRGPRSVVDERAVTLRVEWFAATGEPVAGRVALQRRLVRRPGESMTAKQRRRQPWRTVAHVETGPDGTGEAAVTPRATFRWRAVANDQPWVSGARSLVRLVRNLPPGVPVRLPAGAPRPRINLPPQQRAVGAGANATVQAIPDGVWNQMRGRSWRPGCPVGRAGLRLVRVNYYDYDGYRRRGEMVVAAAVTSNVVGAFTELHARRFPIRSMYRVDRFGWSARLRGADDYASMAAGNSSAFNCRQVVGNPAVRSPHSWGRSVDINPWENPYRSRQGVVPSPWWQSRQHPRYAWRSSSHPVVALMRRHGFRWTYGRSDNHHFDAVAGSRGRLAVLMDGDRARDLCDGVCK